MADILGIGTSGLLAFQRALSTTSHNISNVNTEGYSRQRVEFNTRTPEFVGAGYIGNGVSVTDISRSFDGFIATQLRTQTSNNERYTAFYNLASQIDNMLADPNAGLGPMMDEFFASTQGVADNPNSIPSRQVMLTSAESLADRFHYLETRLSDLNNRVNQQLQATVYDINSLAQSIAHANDEIARARGAAGGASPNDLLDRRDLMITRLSELIDVKTIEQADGMMNVFIGTGQGLVVGTTTMSLAVVPDPLVQGKLGIALQDQHSSVNITRLLSGGKLGGTLEFSNTVLDETRNTLGRIAAAIQVQVNAVHELGIDLSGELGGSFFTPFQPSIYTDNGNVGTGSPTVSYDDVSQLTTNDYLLNFDGFNWQVSNYKTSQPLGSIRPGGQLILHGMQIDVPMLNVPGQINPQAGDQFLIRPTGDAAAKFGMAVNDPAKIAAAGALHGMESLSAIGMPTNLGMGRISDVSALSRDFLDGFDGTLTLTYAAELQGTGGTLEVSGVSNTDYSIVSPFPGINIQPITAFDFSGVNSAQFDVDDPIHGNIVVTLTQNYGDINTLATEIRSQLQTVDSAYNVDVIDEQLVFSKTGQTDGVIIANVDANASSAGFLNSLGMDGGPGASFDIDGYPISLDADYLDANGLVVAMQSQLDALAGPGAYTVSENAGAINILNNQLGSNAVTISNADAGAVLSGFINQVGIAGDPEVSVNDPSLQQFALEGIGPSALAFNYNPDTDAGATFSLVRDTVLDTYRVIRQGDALAANEVAEVSFSLSGKPAAGDSFQIERTYNAVGDNRNALAMAALQTHKGMQNGTATYQSSYGQAVSRVGTQTHQAGINKDASATLRNQADVAFQGVSGVNLDEEAANLIKYQQSYQATAQVITVANRMFQVLLDVF